MTLFVFANFTPSIMKEMIIMSKDQKIFTVGLVGGASLTVVVGSLVVAVKNTVKQFKLLQ